MSGRLLTWLLTRSIWSWRVLSRVGFHGVLYPGELGWRGEIYRCRVGEDRPEHMGCVGRLRNR